MDHTRVRKIPSKSYPLPSEKWDDGWLEPTLNLAKRFAASLIQRLARWSGPATIAGGMLWSVLLVLLYLDWASIWVNGFDFRFHWYLYYLNLRLLIIPMLLFIIGLIGIYSRFTRSLNRAGKAGLLLSIIGFAIATLTTLGVRWFRLDVWLDQFVSQADEFDGLFIVLNMPDPFDYSSILGWYTAVHLGFVLLSVGLLLLCITALRSKALPVWVCIILLISTMSVHLPSFVDPYAYYEYEVQAVYSFGLLASLVFFGVSWATLGYALLRNSRTTHTAR